MRIHRMVSKCSPKVVAGGAPGVIWRLAGWAMAATAFTAACGSQGVPGATLLREDSAGIEIVVNQTTDSAERLGFVGGKADSREIPGLELVSVTAARFLSGDRIVLTDDGGHQLLFVTAEKGVVAAAGRAGPGPGEFRGFRGLWRCAQDTLVVRSGAVGVQLFDSEGLFIRAIRAPEIRGTAMGVSSDCSQIAIPSPRYGRFSALGPDSFVVSWWNLALASGIEVVVLPVQASQVVEFLGQTMPVPVPFAPRPVIAVGSTNLYAGTGDKPEYREYDAAGVLTRIVRWEAAGRELTDEVRRRYEMTRLELDKTVGPGASRRVPQLEHFELPDRMPVYSAMLVDSEGHLWIKRYPRNWEGFERAFGPRLADGPGEWWVFDRGGLLLGRVATPSNFIIKDIRGDAMMALQADSNDVLHLSVFPLAIPELTDARNHK